jgi:RNA polymerase sigma factor (TIGR02999 family)
MSHDRKTFPDSVAALLTAWLNGDAAAGEHLFTTLYRELRVLARRQLGGRQRDGTLDSTALIHEAYLKLLDGSRASVRDRGHFLALASRVMRQVVVDRARRRNATKRGGGRPLTLVTSPDLGLGGAAEDLLDLDRALRKLEALDPRLARIVDLRFFGGLSAEETAQALDVSTATVKREWVRARAFLYQQIKATPPA